MKERIGPVGEPQFEEAPRDRRRDAGLVAAGVGAVLLVWFAIDNSQDVNIHFWVHTSRAPLVVVIVIAGLLGAAVAMLVRWRRRRSAASRDSGPRDLM